MDQQQVVIRSTMGIFPFFILFVVGLAVAKWGFGVGIPAIWVFAPLWLPIVGVALIALVIALVLFLALLLCMAYDWFKFRNRRRTIRKRDRHPAFA